MKKCDEIKGSFVMIKGQIIKNTLPNHQYVYVPNIRAPRCTKKVTIDITIEEYLGIPILPFLQRIVCTDRKPTEITRLNIPTDQVD